MNRHKNTYIWGIIMRNGGGVGICKSPLGVYDAAYVRSSKDGARDAAKVVSTIVGYTVVVFRLSWHHSVQTIIPRCSSGAKAKVKASARQVKAKAVGIIPLAKMDSV